MAWEDIHVDDYGWTGKLRITQDGSAVDVSTYSTLQMILVAPNGTTSTKTAEFTSDGSDGYIQYTILDGDIATTGIWQVYARVAKSGSELTSSVVSFHVDARP